MFIKADWPAPQSIKAGISTRIGGVSLPPYDSLNVGVHVHDELFHVKQNRALLKNHLLLPDEPFWLNQVHSTIALNLDEPIIDRTADASFTTKAKKICVVLTADCLPILLTDEKASFVCAIHAGWRGLADGIIQNTLAKLKPQGQMLAWLAPAISKDHFEVGADVLNTFKQRAFPVDSHFIKTAQQKWHADLYGLATFALHQMGVTQIFGGNFCTYRQKELFYSFRREKQTGRMGSLIWIG